MISNNNKIMRIIIVIIGNCRMLFRASISRIMNNSNLITFRRPFSVPLEEEWIISIIVSISIALLKRILILKIE